MPLKEMETGYWYHSNTVTEEDFFEEVSYCEVRLS